MSHRRLSIRRPLLLAGIGALLCLLSWLAAGIYLYWDDPKLVNFLSAFIPFALTVLIAFIPDQSMNLIKKILWRTIVITAGIVFSVILWHQQVVTERMEARNQKAIVSEANNHSDVQFNRVESELGNTKTNLSSRIDGLGGQIAKSDTDITGAIHKVIIPPPAYANVQFTLSDGSGVDNPFLTQTVQPDQEGTVSIDFLGVNRSDVPAKSLELWVQICDSCSFVKEPDRFEKMKGNLETIRHRSWGLLNPGTATDVMTIKVKPPTKGSPFQIGFTYSCETCGKLKAKQLATITQQTILSGP